MAIVKIIAGEPTSAINKITLESDGKKLENVYVMSAKNDHGKRSVIVRIDDVQEKNNEDNLETGRDLRPRSNRTGAARKPESPDRGENRRDDQASDSGGI